MFTADTSVTNLRSGERAVEHASGRDALGDSIFLLHAVRLRSWSLSSKDDFSTFRLRIGGLNANAQLVYKRVRGPVEVGPVPFFTSSAQALTAVTAYTRLATSGTIGLGGSKQAVTGQSWIEHVTSDAEVGDVGTWDLMTLQFRNGRDLMVYIAHREDGTQIQSALLVNPDGSTMRLPDRRTRLPKEGTPFFWRSDATGAEYPDLIRITYPAIDLDVTIVPAVSDQEVVSARRGRSYWDGAVDVGDFASGGRAVGTGFAQFVGYAFTR